MWTKIDKFGPSLKAKKIHEPILTIFPKAEPNYGPTLIISS